MMPPLSDRALTGSLAAEFKESPLPGQSISAEEAA
jgi:hypothetical protein